MGNFGYERKIILLYWQISFCKNFAAWRFHVEQLTDAGGCHGAGAVVEV